MIQNETNGEEIQGNANIVRGLIEGEILQYVCDEGYEMIGDNNLKCQPDGTFSGPFPFLKAIFKSVIIRISLLCPYFRGATNLQRLQRMSGFSVSPNGYLRQSPGDL